MRFCLRGIVSLALAMTATYSSCGGGCGKSASDSDVAVTVEPVRSRQSSPTVIIPGVLIPHDKVDIKLPQAAKVSEVLVNKGDRIMQGAPLLKLSDEEINLNLSQLRANRKEAEALLEKNTHLLKNRDRMLEEGKIDRTQYDELETEVAANSASLEKIKTDTAVVEYNAAHLQITSPISGIVTEKYATPMQIAPENTVLFVITNTDPILVSFSLTANESPGIKLDMPLKLRVEDIEGHEYTGTISYIGPEIHSEGKTFEVWANIPNPEGVLKAGMQATAEFTSMLSHTVFTVPDTALLSRDRDKFVFTVVNGVAHQTKVRVRNIHDNIAEISDGLAENDLVVVKGAKSLQDGATVQMWRR